MIVHLVLLKFKNKEDAFVVKEALEALPSKIKEIKKYEVGIDFLQGERSFHLAINSEFATKQDLEIYTNHPDHVKVASELIGPLLDSVSVVDYVSEDFDDIMDTGI